MRILIITGSFPPLKCGVGAYTACLAEALANEAVDVAVLTDVEAGDKTLKTKYDIFPIAKKWTGSEFFQIVKTIKHWKPDIVHIQYPSQSYQNRLFPQLLPPLLSLLGEVIVQTWHEYYDQRAVDWNMIPKAITPGGLVVVRPNYKEHMPKTYRWFIRHKVFRFIPNASAIPRAKLSSAERIDIHSRFTSTDKALLVFFGFLYPHKGVELLFEIADPAKHHIVLVGSFDVTAPYYKTIMQKIEQGKWRNNVTVAGFLPAFETAKILDTADAVVLPFRDGGGIWNSSLHAAAIQGTFTLTTSRDRHGYVNSENIYYARLNDIEDMRQALNLYIGRRNSDATLIQSATWETIAKDHINLYHELLGIRPETL
jgi:glycosyltransferase involved in cell wall biosynthesis